MKSISRKSTQVSRFHENRGRLPASAGQTRPDNFGRIPEACASIAPRLQCAPPAMRHCQVAGLRDERPPALPPRSQAVPSRQSFRSQLRSNPETSRQSGRIDQIRKLQQARRFSQMSEPMFTTTTDPFKQQVRAGGIMSQIESQRLFLEGWRRKAGCVALMMALVFLAGWLRSIFVFDIFTIRVGAMNSIPLPAFRVVRSTTIENE